MRLALFDVSHWHFPLYVPALERPGIEIVGVCDGEGIAGPAVARRFGCPLVPREDLLAASFDFALVFSRHVDMPAVAEALIERRRPFLIEKPCGLTSAAVRRLDRLARESHVFVTVPFILRVSDLPVRLTDGGALDPAGFQHLSFRFVPGPLSRYEASAPWMLRADQAGGGSAINVGVHFYDLVSVLTGSPVVSVGGRTQRFRADADVEELAVFTLATASGQIAGVTTGYLYPNTAGDQREFSFSVAHRDAYFQGYADRLAVKRPGRPEAERGTIDYETDRFYPAFLDEALRRLADGRPPIAGLPEAAHALAVVEAGYRSARRGGEVVAVETGP
ncbi:Gfo/Idh/MocA family protein [Labrys wisconsinensis]|uniref:Dehydrogenase n=1 Tax=Labrys wisconsinensis TaxID=425677 RepID=A0ABU0J303_9HYPH|nr:Gfo/Idh/MocA family oxidoreductase [Labrys wisconsinensis]MDQ0467684.1 putative dehydrogenase [Labrys wisconsinensis]